MSISKGIEKAIKIQFLVVEVKDVTEFSQAVEDALNTGWELAGSAYSGKKGSVLMHYQPLKRRQYRGNK